jgi:hypothetical protein
MESGNFIKNVLPDSNIVFITEPKVILISNKKYFNIKVQRDHPGFHGKSG